METGLQYYDAAPLGLHEAIALVYVNEPSSNTMFSVTTFPL